MVGPTRDDMIDPLLRATEDLFGVYIHVPFCRHRCDYCAFATFTDKDHVIGAYLAALDREIRSADDIPMATSIFVGGGTPTRVPARDLANVIAGVRRTSDAEVTIECNPDDLTVEMCREFAAVGVNRLSIGVQSMREHVLISLGRTHDPSNVRRAVEAAREAGIDNINLDIIYGAHGETLADWEATVRGVIALEPCHVSAYGLTVEAGTPLADDSSRHPDDDLQADMYECVDDLLSAAGYANYEVSNWSRPGRESVHNIAYWLQGDYRGFGSAAHSHRQGRRWWNVRTPERYIDLVQSGDLAESSSETLDAEARRIEALQLILRTRVGVPIDAFSNEDVRLLGDLITVDDGRARLTRAGRLLANEVALRLR
jgi:putative oxygen-independent coproporphyrinogen III oxidase